MFILFITGVGKANIQVGPKKYLLISDYKDEAANFYNMPVRSDDIFIVTYPRSGTLMYYVGYYRLKLKESSNVVFSYLFYYSIGYTFPTTELP